MRNEAISLKFFRDEQHHDDDLVRAHQESMEEDVVATKFLNNPRPDKMDIESDCSTPTLCSNEKEKNVIKEPQKKDTKFTPPLEEGSIKLSTDCTALAANVEGVGVSRNVRRRLLASHSSMTMNNKMISETAKLHVGPAYIIENHAIRNRSLSTTPLPYAFVDRRETPTTITESVSTALNVWRCLTAGRSDDPVNASRRNCLEELFTQQENIELETTQTSTTAKQPILKQGDYEMWRLRIEQYFQVQDYALWDVIESENSFVPVTQTTTAEGSDITTAISTPVTAEEKIKKKNDVKARKTRFGGNEATKKDSKDSSEANEDLNLKLLKSLPSEWNTHIVVWRNKLDLDRMSIDDLYNNFKIVKQEVKGNASSNSSSQNIAFVSSSSTNSTNEVYTTYEVSTASTQSSTTST
nr:hypothetical protein [Tanacetum cinerariifolium]